MANVDFEERLKQAERRKKLAEALMSQQHSLDGRMVGRFFVPASPLLGLANLLNAHTGKRESEKADTEISDISKKRKEALINTLKKAQELEAGTPSTVTQSDPTNFYTMRTLPGRSPDPTAAASELLSNPDTQNYGVQLMFDNSKRRESAEIRKQEAEQAQLNRQELQRERLEAQARQDAFNAQLRRDLAANAANAKNNKPMSPTALKLQQDELSAIGTAGSINTSLADVRNKIETGQLKLGPFENLWSRGKNYAGKSDENSRNFASFQATLEKLRNDSLRLNKGVQTEGDAQRAWNEILTNINDEQLVKDRLSEIEQLNNRAIELRKLNVDNIRANYGLDPLSVEDYIYVNTNLNPGAPRNPASSSGRGGNLTPEEQAELEELRRRFPTAGR